MKANKIIKAEVDYIGDRTATLHAGEVGEETYFYLHDHMFPNGTPVLEDKFALEVTPGGYVKSVTAIPDEDVEREEILDTIEVCKTFLADAEKNAGKGAVSHIFTPSAIEFAKAQIIYETARLEKRN